MLRWLLVFSNIAVCVYLVTLVALNPHGGNSRDFIALTGIFVSCALSAFYIAVRIEFKRPSSISRLWRLADLWLVAKEEELRRRGKPDQQNSN